MRKIFTCMNTAMAMVVVAAVFVGVDPHVAMLRFCISCGHGSG